MKQRSLAIILAFFLGGIGAHHAYLGNYGKFLLCLLFSWTLIPAFLGVTDAIMLAMRDEGKFNFKYNAKTAIK